MSPDGRLDPNITPYRSDLAAAHLRGTVTADRYVEGTTRQAIRGIVPLRGRPDDRATQTSELLFGETFTVYEDKDGWLWGQCDHDGYVGYARADGLSAEVAAPTHRICALRAFLFPEPNFKASPLRGLSLGSRLHVRDRDRGYARVAPEGWVHETAIAPIDHVASDPVATAERFLGIPYLWGGRSSLGLDCSGLVQIALAEAGIAAPRDSYLQAASVGVAVSGVAVGGVPADIALKRGDIVFFPGHVGLMMDATVLVHANVAAMCVSRDPVAAVAARTARSDGTGITAIRRLDKTL